MVTRPLLFLALAVVGLGGCAVNVFNSKEYLLYREAYDTGYYDAKIGDPYLFSNNARGGSETRREQALRILRRFNRRIK